MRSKGSSVDLQSHMVRSVSQSVSAVGAVGTDPFRMCQWERTQQDTVAWALIVFDTSAYQCRSQRGCLSIVENIVATLQTDRVDVSSHLAGCFIQNKCLAQGQNGDSSRLLLNSELQLYFYSVAVLEKLINFQF